jgi:hypothetical protein
MVTAVPDNRHGPVGWLGDHDQIVRGFASFVCALLSACASDGPRQRFEADVAPVLERRCLSPVCHGVAPGVRGSGAYLEPRALLVDVTATGAIADLEAVRTAVKRFIDTTERPEFSSLLRKPLDPIYGGLSHRGGVVLRSPEDPAYRAMRDWIAMESGGGEGSRPEDLTEPQRYFADEVLPHLRDGGCFAAACHGRTAQPFTAFLPPTDPASGEWSTTDLRKNHEILRKFLHLAGDPVLGRLIRKPLPVDKGGMVHRGGNDSFFQGRTDEDPRERPPIQALLEWTRREQEALGPGPYGVSTGVVFVRGPAAPAALGELDAYAPGSDLWLLAGLDAGASLENLTADAHGPAAEVRDPAVSHDGTRVAFAMRRSADDCFRIFEIDLATREVRRRTGGQCALPGGGRLADRWPVYGPDGRLWFSSTRAGVLREGGDGLDVDLWSVGEDPDDLVRVTFTPSPELQPAWLSSGKTRGELVFTVLRRLGARYEGVVFRFPPCHDSAHHGEPEYHIHHGVTAGADAAYHARQLPDGREAEVLLDRTTVLEAGTLAVLERSFGPDLPPAFDAVPAVPNFQHSITRLDEGDGAVFRDPMPLPDGTILVARAAAPADASDGARAGEVDFAIERIWLEETRDRGTVVAARETLADASGLWDTAPVPVTVRPPEEDPHEPIWDPAAPTGLLRIRHLRTLQGIYANPFPTGGVEFPEDIAWVRLVEHVDVTPDQIAPVDPAEVDDGDPAAWWISNGVHDRTRILAEIPVAADSSFEAAVPAGVPFRIQALDASRMAIGTQQNRWIFVNGAESFPGGTSPALFGASCAPCHGSASGVPEEAFVVPDAVTTASTTLATNENLDLRWRLDPAAVGDATRIEIDYRRDVQPILDRSCAIGGCHAGAEPARDLSLEGDATAFYSRSYESLLRRGDGSKGGHAWVDERGSSARGSALVERLTGQELEAPAPLSGTCPPAGARVPPLSEEDLSTIVRWIELGATYRAREEAP